MYNIHFVFLKILAYLMDGDDLGRLFCLEYCPHWRRVGGELGEDIVGDEVAGSRLFGEPGGVLDSFGDGGLGGRVLACCLGSRVPGPELSDGVGGSPLLHAIEQ